MIDGMDTKWWDVEEDRRYGEMFDEEKNVFVYVTGSDISHGDDKLFLLLFLRRWVRILNSGHLEALEEEISYLQGTSMSQHHREIHL